MAVPALWAGLTGMTASLKTKRSELAETPLLSSMTEDPLRNCGAAAYSKKSPALWSLPKMRRVPPRRTI